MRLRPVLIGEGGNLTTLPATVLTVTALASGVPDGPQPWAEFVARQDLGADTLPAGPPWPVLGSSVVEGAWSAGEPGLLQVVALSTEPDLPGGFHARFGLHAKWGHDGVPFRSSQGLSSLDADDFVTAEELWLAWDGPLGGGGSAVRVKVGRVDANTEFAAIEVAGDFANPSFGLSPAMAVLPSYPAPAPSANLFVRLGARGPEAGAGVYRTADGSWTAAGRVSGRVSGVHVRWSVGLAQAIGGPGSVGDPGGAYVIVERDEGSIEPFLILAVAGAHRRSPDLVHLAGGFTTALADGPFAPRLGVATSLVRDDASGDEAVAEVFLALRPLPWLTVQPDIQLRLADGAAPAPAGLIRVAITR